MNCFRTRSVSVRMALLAYLMSAPQGRLSPQRAVLDVQQLVVCAFHPQMISRTAAWILTAAHTGMLMEPTPSYVTVTVPSLDRNAMV